MDANQKRTLHLISKLVLNLANGIQFGEKEAFMLPLNTFIIPERKEKAVQFLQSLTVIPQLPLLLFLILNSCFILKGCGSDEHTKRETTRHRRDEAVGNEMYSEGSGFKYGSALGQGNTKSSFGTSPFPFPFLSLFLSHPKY